MLAFSNIAVLSALLASFSLCGLAIAGSHEPSRKRHSGTARIERNHTLSKRFDNARFSFYEAGQGSCGATNSDSDFIVALNSDQYAGGSHCFETITISYKGKSTQAQIVDECPGCGYGGLDFTPGLFAFFASTDDGIIYGSWNFGSGSSDGDSGQGTPAAKPKPSSKAAPSPTPSSSSSSSSPSPTPTPTTSAEVETSTPASASSSSASSSSSSSASTSESATSASPAAIKESATKGAEAAQTASPSPTLPPLGVFDQMNSAYAGLLGLVVAVHPS